MSSLLFFRDQTSSVFTGCREKGDVYDKGDNSSDADESIENLLLGHEVERDAGVFLGLGPERF
jgi:hypothetical protein